MLRAVLFDYGDVLCRPDPATHQALLDIAAVDNPTFEKHYWHDRYDYDLGRLDGPEFWHRFGRQTGRTFTPAQIRALVENDVLMWTTRLEEPMLAWAATLQDAGFATAILSNMPFEIARCMRQEFGWLANFTHLTFSCELGLAKPDPAIYTFTCEQVGVGPKDALFLDDKLVNIEAARRVGLHAVQFHDIAHLRRDLEDSGLLQQLPPLAETEPEVPA
ncbi:MAG TPA: HAD family phosphatase [Acidobacteriaceae bacterium]|jgi:putative hydrolase of the HAD superfamily|nr:HAD family phosphatase [Acidobacteriaceae bacterium]